MIHTLKITAIVENTAGTIDAAGEWGIALWIEADHHRILYDTGQGQTLLRNARLLGIDVAAAEALVISHGHADHTGGIAALVEAGFHGRIYIHPAALSSKYRLEKTPPNRANGIPPASYRSVMSRRADVVESPGPTEIAPGMIVTGAIPRRNTYENVPESFFLDPECTQPDLLIDDQALLIETPLGWTVITGCGHAGLINTLNYTKELIGNGRIACVIGGLHLFCASAERIGATIENLRAFDVELIAPCHCTGFEATGALQREFGNRVVALRAGLSLRIC
jgi:7,8-dihydropterin-6-yl-methyl-4-(beta-D-ribofuranosyl)aminobenzene 5'-phosphate synthase